MINEIDNNKRSLNAMSDLEFTKNQTEMMRYRPNTLSYKLGLGGLGFSVFAAFICLNSFNPSDFQVIIKILLNVAILLAGFLCCEKAKAYSKDGSFTLCVLGGICAARIFWVPLNIIIAYNQYVALYNQNKVEPSNDLTEQMKALANGPWLGKTIMSGFDDTAIPVAILSPNGNFRGIFAIVLLACASALLISAGIIGIIQSKKLSNYMDSLSQKGRR